jgi:hypothetical protein
MHLMEWGAKYNPVLFDWGLYMVYMPSPQAVIFPRKLTSETATIQKKIRSEHSSKITSTLEFAEKIDGLDFGQIMSVLTKRQVLILGRFTNRRLEILEEIKAYLKSHPNKYIPQLFTFKKPDNRDLVESIIGFAAFSKFILADISEPKSIPSELQAIVPNFLSVPVATIINSTGKPYATYSSIERKENVIKPIVRYKNTNDLLKKLDDLIMKAEDKLSELRPA